MMTKNDYMLWRPLFIAVAITHCRCCCCHYTIIHCYPTIVVVAYRSRRPLILDTEFPPPWPLPLPRPLMPLVVARNLLVEHVHLRYLLRSRAKAAPGTHIDA